MLPTYRHRELPHDASVTPALTARSLLLRVSLQHEAYTQAGGFRAFKILIAAEYTGVEVEVPDFKVGEDNKKPEYLAKNPLGKVRVR